MDDWQVPPPHLAPDVMAAFIAAVSSVFPSPIAPKSFTFRKTWYILDLALNGALPWCLMFCIQKGSEAVAVPAPRGMEHDEPSADTRVLKLSAIDNARIESGEGMC